MNYRHAFHAGNFADVVKHLALVSILGHLRRKEAPFIAVDTHAGRGTYDLTGPEAERTGEAAEGIARLQGLAGGTVALTDYLRLASNGSQYPGSPLFMAEMLRPQDRLVAVEKHPGDAATLTEVLKPFRKARVENTDGYSRLVALMPPPERRGVILIDPPYEAPDDFEAAARAFAAAHRRFATGIYMIWFPVKSPAEANGFCGEVLAVGPAKALRIDVVLKREIADGRLSAAGLLVINPPWQFEEEMRQSLALVLPRLGAEPRFERLVGGP